MKYKFMIWVSIAGVTACGGGGDSSPNPNPNPPPVNSIQVSACTSTGDDSFPDATNPPATDRETRFERSHTIGNPTYHIVTTRDLADGTDVTMDYMVHLPTGTPKALVVLIAGGGLNAGIEGTTDGSPVTASRGNYLVRSAHRFMNAGYKVVTIDRPSDYVNYNLNNGSYLYDQYRNAMDHAVDLATVIERENTNNWPVFIAGTSRGSISAAANNTLVNGVSLSSALTYDNPAVSEDSPIGSTQLPISVLVRDVHVFLHTNDGCSVTTPADSRALFENLKNAGHAVSGSEVSGGFSDTLRNDPCGGFDFHGFNGIENCAVSKETGWMDKVLASLTSSGNTQPDAGNGDLQVGQTIDLSTLANDMDGDTLSYSLPYATSALGGMLSVDANTGLVTYTPPGGAVTGSLDTFAYVVTDGKGGVATAVVSLETQ